MSKLNETQLMMILKSFSRADNIPIDASSVWDTKAEAEAYAKQANAYGGQVITALVNGKYKTYVLQPSDGGYLLEEVGGVQPEDLKQYVQVVDSLPKDGQEQGVIYITGTTGQVWTGTTWRVVFKEVSTKVDQIGDKVTQLGKDITTKAPIASPEFTGKVTVNGDEVAAKSYVDGLINGLVSSAPGLVSSKSPLPTAGYKAGQTFRVAEDGTYAGNKCEVGDLIIVTKSYSDKASNDDFMVVQANIDGAVTSTAESSTVGEIVVFNSVSGKIIGKSDVNIASLKDTISKAHSHGNADILDSFTKTQTQILSEAETTAKTKVDELANVVKGKADKGTSLKDYGITNAYTKAEIDGKIDTINNSLNSKISAADADAKIGKATETITDAYRKAISDSETNIKTYVNEAVAGVDFTDQINKSKTDAISAAKVYTDEAITKIHTVTEF